MSTEQLPIFYVRMAKDGLNVKGRLVVRTGPYFRHDVAARQQRVNEFVLQLRELGLEVVAKVPEGQP